MTRTANRPKHHTRVPDRPDLLGSYIRLLYLHLNNQVNVATAATFPEVTPAMKQVLMLVDRDSIRLTDLAEAVGMTKQSTSQHVDRLIQLGLLVRVPDPSDRRAKLIRPTSDGLMCINHALRVEIEVHDQWTTLLGEREAKHLMTLLCELEESLEGRDRHELTHRVPTGTANAQRRQGENDRRIPVS